MVLAIATYKLLVPVAIVQELLQHLISDAEYTGCKQARAGQCADKHVVTAGSGERYAAQAIAY